VVVIELGFLLRLVIIGMGRFGFSIFGSSFLIVGLVLMFLGF